MIFAGDSVVNLSMDNVGTKWRGGRSASCTDWFTSEEIGPVIHWLGDWLGSVAGLDAVEKRETCIGRESNSGSLVIQSGDWPLS
jgi:hypothetical protein